MHAGALGLRPCGQVAFQTCKLPLWYPDTLQILSKSRFKKFISRLALQGNLIPVESLCSNLAHRSSPDTPTRNIQWQWVIAPILRFLGSDGLLKVLWSSWTKTLDGVVFAVGPEGLASPLGARVLGSNGAGPGYNEFCILL